MFKRQSSLRSTGHDANHTGLESELVHLTTPADMNQQHQRPHYHQDSSRHLDRQFADSVVSGLSEITSSLQYRIGIEDITHRTSDNSVGGTGAGAGPAFHVDLRQGQLLSTPPRRGSFRGRTSESPHRGSISSSPNRASFSSSPDRTSMSQSSAPSSSGVNQIMQNFKCMICLNNLRDAHLCPHCSKMTCLNCVTKWLHQHNSCPHCRKPLHLEGSVAPSSDSVAMVNCRWADDVTEQLSDLGRGISEFDSSSVHEGGDICHEHAKPLSIYCKTCSECICHLCAIPGLGSNMHDGHAFANLDEVYDDHVKSIGKHLKELRQKKKELLLLAQGVDRNAAQIRASYESHSADLAEFLDTQRDQIRKNLDIQMDRKRRVVLEKKSFLSTQTRELEQVLFSVDEQLRSAGPAELVQSAEDLFRLFGHVMQTKINSSTSEDIPIDFISPWKPRYVRGETRVHIGNSIVEVNQHEPTYSDPIHSCGHLWRLKTYRNGTQSGLNSCLSVFLELLDGPPSSIYSASSKYEWRVELVRRRIIHRGLQDSQDRPRVREYACSFEVGECWGYETFYELKHLHTDGFVDDEGYITLVFGVRTISYVQQCEMQQWWISKLETKEENPKPETKSEEGMLDSSQIDSSYKKLLLEKLSLTPKTLSQSENAADNAVVAKSETPPPLAQNTTKLKPQVVQAVQPVKSPSLTKENLEDVEAQSLKDEATHDVKPSLSDQAKEFFRDNDRRDVFLSTELLRRSHKRYSLPPSPHDLADLDFDEPPSPSSLFPSYKQESQSSANSVARQSLSGTAANEDEGNLDLALQRLHRQGSVDSMRVKELRGKLGNPRSPRIIRKPFAIPLTASQKRHARNMKTL